jgi:hypothetical protein
VSASADRVWDLSLLTLERDFGPFEIARSELKPNTRSRAANVHIAWPDGQGEGDRVEVLVTPGVERTELVVTANNHHNAATVRDGIVATLEENGIAFEPVDFRVLEGPVRFPR